MTGTDVRYRTYSYKRLRHQWLVYEVRSGCMVGFTRTKAQASYVCSVFNSKERTT